MTITIPSEEGTTLDRGQRGASTSAILAEAAIEALRITLPARTEMTVRLAGAMPKVCRGDDVQGRCNAGDT